MNKLTSILAIATSLVGADAIQAQSSHKNDQQNPFTLVYEGAIQKNEPRKVNLHPVTYKLHGIEIAANVYTPAHYESSKNIRL